MFNNCRDVPISPGLGGILCIIATVHTVDRQGWLVPKSLSSMPVVTGYSHDLRLLFTGDNLIELALRWRSSAVVVGANLQRAFEDYEVVYLTPVVSVPTPNHPRIAE